jgi:hypothetical protein
MDGFAVRTYTDGQRGGKVASKRLKAALWGNKESGKNRDMEVLTVADKEGESSSS